MNTAVAASNLKSILNEHTHEQTRSNDSDTGTGFKNCNKDKIMKVMCFFIGQIGEYAPEEGPMKIKVGGDYIVVDVCDEPDGEYFELAHDIGWLYPSEFFAILPDPSEEVGIEAEQEAIIYQR